MEMREEMMTMPFSKRAKQSSIWYANHEDVEIS